MKPHSQRIARVSEPPVDRMNRAVARLSAAGREVLNLGQGVPDFGPPPGALERWREVLADPAVHRYTPDLGLPELREAVAAQLREGFGVSGARAEEVVISGGANHGFVLVAAALFDEGDRVGLLSPVYLNHPMALEGAGVEVVECLPEADLTYDPAALEARVEEEGLVALVVINPSNPTGKVFTRDELEEILEVCRRRGIWLIVDEVYRSFLTGQVPMTSIASLPGTDGRVVTLGSYSKELGMTGWRVGWIHAPEELVEKIGKAQDYSLICAPHAGQRLVLEGLRAAPDWATRHAEGFAERRRAFLEPLARSGLFEIFDPEGVSSGAFFVWFRPRAEIDSWEEAPALLEKTGVCLMPGTAFGESWGNWFRASYGSQSLPVLEPAAVRIVEYFGARGG